MNQVETLSQSLIQKTEGEVQNPSIGILLVSVCKPEDLITKLKKSGYNCDHYPFSPSENYNFRTLSAPIQLAQKENLNLVIALDTTGQITNLAVRKSPDKLQLLTFNQLVIILVNQIIEENTGSGQSIGVIKTMYITELLDKIVQRNDYKCNTFIGDESAFADHFQDHRNDEDISIGISDSQNLLVHTKSGEPMNVIEVIAKLEKKMSLNGASIFDKLLMIYRHYGFYKEKTFTIEINNKQQQEQFDELMNKFRKKTPLKLGSQPIKLVEDFQKQVSYNLKTGKKNQIHNDPSNVMRITLEDGIQISLSHNDHKISYHISVSGIATTIDDYNEMSSNYSARVMKYMELINRA